MSTAKKDFERSVLVERLAARFAGEFTPAEWETHKKEHPGADIKDHTIRKPEDDKAKSDDKPKDEKKEESKADKPKSKPAAINVHPDTIKTLRQNYTQKTNDHDLGAWGGNNNAVRDLINHAGKGKPVSKGDVDRALSFLKNQRAGEGRDSARKKLDEVKRQLEHVRKHL